MASFTTHFHALAKVFKPRISIGRKLTYAYFSSPSKAHTEIRVYGRDWSYSESEFITKQNFKIGTCYLTTTIQTMYASNLNLIQQKRRIIWEIGTRNLQTDAEYGSASISNINLTNNSNWTLKYLFGNFCVD